MRLLLEITRTPEGKHFFKIYDHIDTSNDGIIGSGWTVRSALDDFAEQLRRHAFHDDDTPIRIERSDFEIAVRKYRLECKKFTMESIS